jgi:hypothetical protein
MYATPFMCSYLFLLIILYTYLYFVYVLYLCYLLLAPTQP